MAFTYATDLKALTTQQKIKISLENHSVLLIYDEKQVFAINDKCPHMGASLNEGTYDNGIITCPKHRVQINVKDGSIIEKAKILFFKVPVKSAQTYLVKIEDEKIYIDI